ncbi:DMT family transporter [Roseimaritima sediminicola]|uniref:DMT family transporter n=1 Tax=Roseimaritima sediminicola TaxID=2662066 RepID=UPI00129826C7|nr:multidrug efflux SMR transporter [Roseimaritima sediminicola]
MESWKAWLLLVAAGMLETGWAVGLKYTAGFTRLWPSLWTGLAMAASMFLLAVAIKKLPIGTAYPVWVGIGALGTALFGMAFLDEPVTWSRSLFLILLVLSIVGLKMSS